MNELQQEAIANLTDRGDRSENNNTCNPNPGSNRRYQHSGKNSPCPICSRIKDNDCRWNDEVVLCHTYVDQDAAIPGYVYRGGKEIWGQYFPEPNQVQKSVRQKATKEFIYSDAEGSPLIKVTRIDDGAGSKRIFQSRWDGKNWITGLTPEIKKKIRLYRIDDPINQEAIAQDNPLLIVEGEGKVDLLLGLGIAATCSIGGAGKWKCYGYPKYRQELAGAEIVLCPDRDKPGLDHCLDIEQDFPEAQWLYAFPDSELWNRLPDKGGLDVADWIATNRLTREQILAAIEPKRKLGKSSKADTGSPEPEKKTIAQLLLEIAQEATYFRTPDHKIYADIWVNEIRKTYPVRRKAFKQWLQYELFKRYQKTAGSETLSQVLGVVEAKANFEGEVREVYLRIAEHEGKVYLDLGTEDWRVVEISPKGWQVVSDYPVRFRRTETLLPLPIPEAGGKLTDLRQILNLDDDAWSLVMHWLLFSFYPKYPHPVLILHGEQGSGKSYTARVLRTLVDPGKAPLIPNISDLRNLAIAAENRWILAYDNLSGLNADQSDALCRISTGGGFSTRTLYENDEETVFEFIRPQILTGIDSLATRGDLLERALLVQLPTIPAEQRATEAQLEASFAQLQARILGAFLTALSQTLKILPQINPGPLPRMADFARFAIAAETALDLPVGSFLKVYLGNRQEAHETVLDSSPIAVAIQRLMANRQHWKGSATDLLGELEQLVDEKTVKSKIWVGNARSLGKVLIRLAPDLRGIGIEITQHRTRSSRLYKIERLEKQMSFTSPTSRSLDDRGLGNDAEHTNVTEPRENDTGDKTGTQQWQTSSEITKNVIPKRAFHLDSDDDDVSDMKNPAESSWVGKTVRKLGKHGWRGIVESASTQTAWVLWMGDLNPTLVNLSELEESG